MIQPPGTKGVAFTEASDGDQRPDGPARRAVAARLGIPRRVGNGSTSARPPRGPPQCTWPSRHVWRSLGEADALWTSVEDLPLAVRTADCFGVVLLAEGAVGVAHAGWRGAELGVVNALLHEMEQSGFPAKAAAVGPGIGPCCFEVGEDVARRFEGFQSTTSWGTRSVDLGAGPGGSAVGYWDLARRIVYPSRRRLVQPSAGQDLSETRHHRLGHMSYEMVRERVQIAAEACGRDPAEITLIAVSKAKSVSQILAVYDQGHRDFGRKPCQGDGREGCSSAR